MLFEFHFSVIEIRAFGVNHVNNKPVTAIAIYIKENFSGVIGIDNIVYLL